MEQEHPLFTIRVERLAEDWEAHAEELAAVGLWRDCSIDAAATEMPQDLNASTHKFSLPKPKIAAEHFRALPMDLWEGLSAFCGRYGYSFPGDGSSKPRESV